MSTAEDSLIECLWIDTTVSYLKVSTASSKANLHHVGVQATLGNQLVWYLASETPSSYFRLVFMPSTQPSCQLDPHLHQSVECLRMSQQCQTGHDDRHIVRFKSIQQRCLCAKKVKRLPRAGSSPHPAQDGLPVPHSTKKTLGGKQTWDQALC